VLIPADVTPENVTTSIVDCSLGNEGEAYITSELKQANVVCIVYTVSDDNTIKRVTDKWLPLLRDVYGPEHEIPVILVGNKSDGSTNHTDKVLPIMERWPEVETCVECSAKTMKNVSEIFFYAQKAVVHPTRPLYDADEKRLTDKTRKALIRVFKICDRDNDGYLNDAELNEFQKLCFGIPLTSAAIEDILSAVETNARGWITYAGYMAYWNMTTLINVSQTMEQLAYLGFAVGRSTQTRAGSSADAIKITRERKIDLTERGTTRRVFQCLVVGAKDTGKSVFMQSLVGRGLLDATHAGRRHYPYVINRVKVKEEIKYLLLREVDVLSPQDVLSSAETAADVVAFLYDISNPESFAFCATIYQKYFYRTRTPCVIIATKVEREEVEQRWEVSPEEFCRQFELPRPIRFTNSQRRKKQSEP
ncbi:EF hand associated, partial [Teladorsagia circumcincta]